MPQKIFFAFGLGLLFSTTAVYAAPITTPPPTLSAVGDVTAVYVFADAADTSILNEVTPRSINQMFCNHSSGSCTASNSGDTMDLGIQNGAMVFSLDNLTTGSHFVSNAPDASGDYHVVITTNYADFGVGALPSAANTVITGLLGSGKSVTYVGWEDLMTGQVGADFDYNDLIFAFANTRIPEPLTLSLFAAGFAGLVGLRRRRKA